MSSDFHFLVPESFHKKLVRIGTEVSEKIRSEFLYVHDLGPRSRKDIDLQYSHTFIYSIKCLLLLAFSSLAALVSEKSGEQKTRSAKGNDAHLRGSKSLNYFE